MEEENLGINDEKNNVRPSDTLAGADILYAKKRQNGIYRLLRQSRYSIKVLTAMDALLRLLSAKQIER